MNILDIHIQGDSKRVLQGQVFIIKGAEANLYTFREQPVSGGIQICFHTLYQSSSIFHYYLVFDILGHTMAAINSCPGYQIFLCGVDTHNYGHHCNLK